MKLLVLELSDVQTIHQSTFGSKIGKQRLSKANQRLWSMKFWKWDTRLSFTVSPIKHTECKFVQNYRLAFAFWAPVEDGDDGGISPGEGVEAIFSIESESQN